MIAQESTPGRLEETGLASFRRALTKQANPWLVFAALNLLAIAFYIAIAARLGFFSHMEATLFSSPDSNVYRDVANWLWGSRPNTLESQRRPFLFPLLLGAADRIAGAAGIWIFNLVCWLGTLNVTAIAVLRMTRRLVSAIAVFLVLASSVSLIALNLQALTEPLTGVLEAVWILGLAIAGMPPSRPRDFALVLTPITLLTVVRPGNEVVLLIAAILTPVAIWRMRQRRVAAVLVVALSCIPLMVQLGLMEAANHFFGLSSAGAEQFRDYYASQVYASVKGLPADLVVARLAVHPMSNLALGLFLISHPAASLDIFLSNLRDNLTSGSSFIDPATTPTLARAARWINRSYLLLHAVFLPIVAVAIWRQRDFRLIVLVVFLAALVLLCSLINTQGDRYVLMTLPLWTAAYALATTNLFDRPQTNARPRPANVEPVSAI